MRPLIPISVGELIDKLSILQVKKNKITNPEKLKIVELEFSFLENLSLSYLKDLKIKNYYSDLVSVNSELWEIEDMIRDLESQKKFDSDFIECARKVYITNDKRFQIKNEINNISRSEIREVKDYKNYLND